MLTVKNDIYLPSTTPKLPVAPQPSTPLFSSGVSKLSNVQFPQLKKGAYDVVLVDEENYIVVFVSYGYY
jgi:hypothetical protein